MTNFNSSTTMNSVTISKNKHDNKSKRVDKQWNPLLVTLPQYSAKTLSATHHKLLISPVNYSIMFVCPVYFSHLVGLLHAITTINCTFNSVVSHICSSVPNIKQLRRNTYRKECCLQFKFCCLCNEATELWMCVFRLLFTIVTLSMISIADNANQHNSERVIILSFYG